MNTDRTVILSFSGGKDSVASLLYLRERGRTVVPVFCDTKWEHDLTYKYLDYIDTAIQKVHRVDPPLGFVELAKKKKRFPSVKARFCTTELKLKPLRSWVMKAMESGLIPQDVIMACGVRADESPSRAKLPEWQDSDDFFCLPQWRPIISWTADDVFAIHKKYGIEPNPLYKLGMRRVGCMPCIMTSLVELAEIGKRFPEVIEKCAEAEAEAEAAFDHNTLWSSGDIPDRWTSKRWISPKDGKEYCIPTARDVFAYAAMDQQTRRMAGGTRLLFETEEEAPSCKSSYGLCE
jgi:3'-phosphoadenosine 5'-phosphosulfate sulfotransferase (PAPS reductase)/FAD synthetase